MCLLLLELKSKAKCPRTKTMTSSSSLPLVFLREAVAHWAMVAFRTRREKSI